MRAFAILVVWLATACGDNDKKSTQLAPCLDEHTDLARPPDGQLPCELLPPGFTPQ
ncbi:MAG: hypothetical protein AB7O24_08615 [Kofleriaceae bacterium]